ncbi:MAG TPA: carboxypeptidase regulatory-like domain-containing protein [Terriglobales bacterium]|nr:carboxypeptidase regulatory-like domain-containing protein [Terriglobales bacterium]
MMRAPAAIVCVLLLAGVLPAQQGSSAPSPSSAAHPASGASLPEPSGFRLAGVVVNAATGQPMASASVAIARLARGASRDISQSVVTGPDGHFAFSALAQGKYSLVGRARGFGFQAFERHDQYSTAIAVGSGLDSEHLVFRLQPDASLDGVVTDENNDPVQYAMVRLFYAKSRDGGQRGGPIQSTQTDDQGHYRLGHLEPGVYYLAVSARPWYAQNVRAPSYTEYYKQFTGGPGAAAQNTQDDATLDVTYPLTFYPDATDSADALPLQLAPGAHETANMVLRAVPSLHLRIHSGEGAQKPSMEHMAFPRVSQRIFDGYLDSVFNAPESSAPGVVEIAGLAPGHYVIEVPASSSANEKASSRAWYREIDLAGDADINANDNPGFAAVGGSILFENAAVPTGASIELMNPETGESFRSSINSRGGFEFPADSVRPGRYLVALESARDFYVKRLVATGGKMAGRALEVGPSANVRLAAIAAAGEGQVDGTALHDDVAFSGAMIVLVPQDAADNAPLFRRDQSDSDGTFTLPNIVPGQYTVIALANGWDLDWSSPAVLQPYLKRGAVVQVPPGGKLQVKVQVQ